MRHLLPALLLTAISATAQVPCIDMGFQWMPPEGQIFCTAQQPDGKLLVGGWFSDYAGSGIGNLVRLNPDGSLDPTFNTGGPGPNNAVVDMDLMPDGRIIIGGNFLTYNGTSAYFVARVMPNGTLDTTFDVPANSINGAVWAVALQGPKVVTGGEFFVCSGHSYPHIARFNYNGDVDTTFNVGTGFSNNVYDIKILPDQRVLVGGAFGMFNGTFCGRLALLQPDGPIDGSMVIDPGFGIGTVVKSLALTPGATKAYAAGYFTDYNGQPSPAIARVNLDGTLDATFNSPFYPYAPLRAVALQADGKVLVGGDFLSSMYDPPQPGPQSIARLNPDGSLDNTFAVGAGVLAGDHPTGYVNHLTVQMDQRIVAAGYFGAVDTVETWQELVRFMPTSTVSVDEPTAMTDLRTWYDAAIGELVIAPPQELKGTLHMEMLDATGRLLWSNTTAAPASPWRRRVNAPAGCYLVVLRNNEFRRTGRVVIP